MLSSQTDLQPPRLHLAADDLMHVSSTPARWSPFAFNPYTTQFPSLVPRELSQGLEVELT
jgi:hypothetical protein